MLPAYIIEELRRREHARRQSERPQPALERPLPPQPDPEPAREERGVVIIEIF